MKTILFTATALSLTGAALANGNEWSALDREVEALASSLVDNHDGIHIGAYADVWYRNQAGAGRSSGGQQIGENTTALDGGFTGPVDPQDPRSYTTGFYTFEQFDQEDLSAFGINNARVMLSGESGDFGAYIEYQFATGSYGWDPTNDFVQGEVGTPNNTDNDTDDNGTPADPTDDTNGPDEFEAGSGSTGGTVTNNALSYGGPQLLDAYITQDLGGMKLTMGRFKVVGNASAMEHERDMFFATRSNIGYHYATRDEGVQLSGSDGFNWSVGIANGGDDGLAADDSDYRISVHGDMDFGGGLTGGLTYTDDASNEDDKALIIDLSYSMDNLTVMAEMANIAEGGGGYTGNGDGSVFGYTTAVFGATNGADEAEESSPYSIAVTYGLGGDSAIGIRMQDADNDDGDRSIDVAYNWSNWSIQYSQFDNDNDDVKAMDDMLVVSCQVGF